ncbi:MAG TPA: hypothetical protein PK141_21150, partial [Polyangiaceae bacterium]|nr:hypothetical protein [Polyangiaceae bacterium]
MSHKLCLACAVVVGSGARCASCGAVAVSPTRENLARALEARVQVAIDAWEAEGALDDDVAARLRNTPSRDAARAEGTVQAAQAADDPGVFERLSARRREIATRWDAAVARLEADAARPASEPASPAHARSPGDVRDAVEVGEGLFGGGHEGHGHGASAGVGAGVGALLGLDDLGPPSSKRPGSSGTEASLSPSGLFAEYAWWFLGTLLVLAGSAMGVREAWRPLAG